MNVLIFIWCEIEYIGNWLCLFVVNWLIIKLVGEFVIIIVDVVVEVECEYIIDWVVYVDVEILLFMFGEIDVGVNCVCIVWWMGDDVDCIGICVLVVKCILWIFDNFDLFDIV